MRKPFGKLVDDLEDYLRSDDANKVTVGDLATRFDESAERILDALDALKMAAGLPTYIPSLDTGHTCKGKVREASSCPMCKSRKAIGSPAPSHWSRFPERKTGNGKLDAALKPYSES